LQRLLGAGGAAKVRAQVVESPRLAPQAQEVRETVRASAGLIEPPHAPSLAEDRGPTKDGSLGEHRSG
jgi:hypothetical protein